MPKFLVIEEGRKPVEVQAKYEAAAATNYVGDVAKGPLRTVRRVSVRQIFSKSFGPAIEFDIVDHEHVCQSFSPGLSESELLAKADVGVSEGVERLRPLALQLGATKGEVEEMSHKELLEFVSSRMPEDGSSVTVKRKKE